MNIKTPVLLATLLALAACGCGSGGGGARGTGTSGAAASTPASAPARAVAECRHAIAVSSTLPAAARQKLEDACAKAVSGDRAAVRRAAREVCEEAVQRSSLPLGPAREQALKACRQG